MPLPYNKKNKPFAQRMRNHVHATRQENHLWYDDKEFFMVCDYIDQTVKSIIGDA